MSAGGCLHAGSRALIAVLACAAIAVAAPTARAVSIERVVSPGGIEAWLVSDRTLPLIATKAPGRSMPTRSTTGSSSRRSS